MRQDLLQRQKHIRKFHQSIEKYQQSPTTKKAFIKATMELQHAIQYKFKKSQINNNYVFPKNTSISDDQYDSDVQIVDLKSQNDFLSQDLSIAEQPESNTVYVSEKTVLIQEKCLSFYKQKNDGKSKLKIKVIKKKNNFDTCEVGSKLEHLKTQHIQTNFSTASYKYENQSKNQNDSIQGKKWLLQPSTQVNHLRKKLKIATRIQNQQSGLSPSYANLTMKTEYSYCNKRKQGKQNQRSTLNPHLTQKYYLTHNSSKKIQPFGYKLHINVKSTKNKTKQIKQNIENSVENCKKKVSHKSFENLKSIKLGHNKSNEKIKTIRGLHA